MVAAAVPNPNEGTPNAVGGYLSQLKSIDSATRFRALSHVLAVTTTCVSAFMVAILFFGIRNAPSLPDCIALVSACMADDNCYCLYGFMVAGPIVTVLSACDRALGSHVIDSTVLDGLCFVQTILLISFFWMLPFPGLSESTIDVDKLGRFNEISQFFGSVGGKEAMQFISIAYLCQVSIYIVEQFSVIFPGLQGFWEYAKEGVLWIEAAIFLYLLGTPILPALGSGHVVTMAVLGSVVLVAKLTMIVVAAPDPNDGAGPAGPRFLAFFFRNHVSTRIRILSKYVTAGVEILTIYNCLLTLYAVFYAPPFEEYVPLGSVAVIKSNARLFRFFGFLPLYQSLCGRYDIEAGGLDLRQRTLMHQVTVLKWFIQALPLIGLWWSIPSDEGLDSRLLFIRKATTTAFFVSNNGLGFYSTNGILVCWCFKFASYVFLKASNLIPGPNVFLKRTAEVCLWFQCAILVGLFAFICLIAAASALYGHLVAVAVLGSVFLVTKYWTFDGTNGTDRRLYRGALTVVPFYVFMVAYAVHVVYQQYYATMGDSIIYRCSNDYGQTYANYVFHFFMIAPVTPLTIFLYLATLRNDDEPLWLDTLSLAYQIIELLILITGRTLGPKAFQYDWLCRCSLWLTDENKGIGYICVMAFFWCSRCLFSSYRALMSKSTPFWKKVAVFLLGVEIMMIAVFTCLSVYVYAFA